MGNDVFLILINPKPCLLFSLLQLNKTFRKKQKFQNNWRRQIADCFPLCERGKNGTRGRRQGDQGPLATHRRVEHRVPKPGRYSHYFSLLQAGTTPTLRSLRSTMRR